MNDCQNETYLPAVGYQRQNCGQTQTHVGNGVWYPELKEPSFAQLQGFPDYEAYQRGVQAALSKCNTAGYWQCTHCMVRVEAGKNLIHTDSCILNNKDTGLASLGEQAQTLAARMGQLQLSDDSDTLRAQVLADKLIKEENERQQKMKAAQALYAYFAKSALEVVNITTKDPDGALIPLPVKPIPARTVSAPSHDFIGALYKPYFSPI